MDLRISQIRTGPISSKLNKGWSFLLDKYDSGFFLIFGMELAIFWPMFAKNSLNSSDISLLSVIILPFFTISFIFSEGFFLLMASL